MSGATGSPPTEVIAFDAAAVSSAFANGKTMLANERYIVACAHRTESSHAEIHVESTDLFYVVEGSATLVTGGEVVGAFEESPGEIRGERIEGGSQHKLTKGSIIVIPKGTPHWFSEVDGPLLYHVVKVTE